MRMFKNLFIALALVALPLGASRITAVHAASLDDAASNLSTTNEETGLAEQDLTTTIGSLIGVLLSVLGVIFLLLTIYAGFTYMTAQGDPKKVDKAKDILITSVVGLIILMSAYAISTFVIDSLVEATGT
jgi:heme/copper-type cytochrome/quinol oxidase subunit 2